MKVLVLNCGSSSIKYQLFEMPAGTVLAKGSVQRLGEDSSPAEQRTDRGEIDCEAPVADHQQGLQLVLKLLTNPERGAIADVAEISACGHRVVHGGERFSGSMVIDADLEHVIDDFSDLAPLHNPPNLTGIREAKKAMPGVPQVACFDTAFHQTIPETAYLYALPYELYERYRVRRYGFHGTSHEYVAQRAAAMLGRPADQVNLITCHLGNGCSITAIRAGHSVDTSMGFTPLEGVVMGTRSGSFDPAIIFYLERKGYTVAQVDKLVNKESGLLGVSGSSNDVRDLETQAAAGDRRARLALDLFAYSVRKYIGAYLAVLNGGDAVVFTGGIGEHGAAMRGRIAGDLEQLGIVLDKGRNEARSTAERDIAAPESRIRLLVIPTDEEKMIASETYHLLDT